MEAVFLKFFNMTITASYVILAVLLVRLLLKRTPKKYTYALWSVVGFRLCCPVSFQSAFSVFGLKYFDMTKAQQASGGEMLTYIPEDIGRMQQPQITFGVSAGNTIDRSLPAPMLGDSVNPIQILVTLATYVWMAGIAVLTIYSIFTFVRLHLRLRTAIRLEDGVYQSEFVVSPFVMGFFRPKIYLPFAINAYERSYVLAHERFHIRHCDHLIKIFAYFLLCLHWYNPLCWLAFLLMSRDMEMRCDEWILGRQIHEQKAYAETLLAFAVKRSFPAPGPLAFGEFGIRARIKNALRWKSPKRYMRIFAFTISLIFIVACAANPKEATIKTSPFGYSYEVEEIVFASPYYSFSYTTQNAPFYLILEDGELLSKLPGQETENTEDEWIRLGKVEEFELEEDNFDQYFYGGEEVGGGWKGINALTLRLENENAWRVLRTTEHFTEMYIILQQKNGDLFLCYGYYDQLEHDDPNSDDSSFRWVFQLEKNSSAASIGGVDLPHTVEIK